MSKGFIRANWIALVLIYAVIFAGSLVRTTGSGMGCPDWPKCFGSWVPPTNADQLPDDYGHIYVEKRITKVEKFAKMLDGIGMGPTADKLRNDPELTKELPFNMAQTWTEYGNRLAGFLCGNVILIVFAWSWIRYRKQRKLVLYTTVSLILLIFQAWFGSIVVATNLVPWTITVHMALALLMIIVQLRIIYMCRKPVRISLPGALRTLLIVIFLITLVQMFLGTQVRESIDELTRKGIGREEWSAQLGIAFFIHRSFSWAVLGLLILMVWLNRAIKFRGIPLAFGVLTLELISGVLLAYAGIPAFVQISHLLFATILFGMLYHQIVGTRGLQRG